MAKLTKHEKRERRHLRIRKKIFGSSERPRLCIYRSTHSFYAQIIDDESGKTLTSASTIDKEFTKLSSKRGGKSIEDVKLLAQILVNKAKEAGISKVVFDRGGFLYHGRVKAFAEACRELGLDF
ncbi:MAG: 50S ribosomal protein L18 [Aquificaceae bacterium]|nr:50S ribosomal protein L18 [Aquificaceae bacterium]MDW8237751.1 50S ribosomal protein L18 [Aquificaceae bacterium]